MGYLYPEGICRRENNVDAKRLLLARKRSSSHLRATSAHTPATDIRAVTSAFALISSVLPPGTDLRGGASEGPNLTPSGLCNKSARSDANRCLREQPVATQAAEQVFISCLVCVGAPVSHSRQEVGINGFALREKGLCLGHRVEVRNRDRAAK